MGAPRTVASVPLVKFRQTVVLNHVPYLGDIFLPAFGVEPQALGQRQAGKGFAVLAQPRPDGAQRFVLGVAVQIVQIAPDGVPDRGKGLNFVVFPGIASFRYDAAVGFEAVLAE